MEDIPGELVINWDQTGIELVPSTMEKRERRVEKGRVNDKRQITAIFCGNAEGIFYQFSLFTLEKHHVATQDFHSHLIGMSLMPQIIGQMRPR